MRGLTSRGLRPYATGSHAASPAASFLPPIHQSITPLSRRKLTSADTFAILLGPVLTAAFVIDTSSRAERSVEWDRQIAALEAETEALRQKQLDAWTRIQHRSVRNGLRHGLSRGCFHQTRSMSSIAGPAKPDDADMDPLLRQKELESDIDAPPASVEANPKPKSEPNEDHVAMQARLERLIATRLALQLMLQLRTGRASAYNREITVEPGTRRYTHSVDYLIREVENVFVRIRTCGIDRVPFDITMPTEFWARKHELGGRLDLLANRYRDGDIHLPDFIMSYVKHIGEYKMGPPLRSYAHMMRSFSIMIPGSPLAAMAENAILDAHQPLDNFVISNILYRHGSDAESARHFDFLDRLTKEHSVTRPLHPWYRTEVNNLQIAIPYSRNPHLLTCLIRASLCNRLQSIAEAQATVFLRRAEHENPPGIFRYWVSSAFLRHYSVWGSWNIGKRWLQTTVQWAQDFLDSNESILGRAVLGMLDFCVACNRRDEYHHILTNAVAYHLRVPDLDDSKPIYVSERMQQIRLDWISRVKESRPHNMWRKVFPSDVERFQTSLHGVFDGEQTLPLTKPYHPTEGDFQEDPPPLSYNPLIDAERMAGARLQRYMRATVYAYDMSELSHPSRDHWIDEKSESSPEIPPEISEPEISSPSLFKPMLASSDGKSMPEDSLPNQKVLDAQAAEIAELKLQLAEANKKLNCQSLSSYNSRDNEVEETFVPQCANYSG